MELLKSKTEKNDDPIICWVDPIRLATQNAKTICQLKFSPWSDYLRTSVT